MSPPNSPHPLSDWFLKSRWKRRFGASGVGGCGSRVVRRSRSGTSHQVTWCSVSGSETTDSGDSRCNHGAALARAISAKLPTGGSARFPWREVGLFEPTLPVSIGVRDIKAPCAGLTEAGVIQSVEKTAPSATRSAATSDIRMELQDFDCDIKTQVVGEEPVNSTYIASYQQVTNADYVQLQQRLAGAQQNLAQVRQQNALNPPQNGWQGAAQAIAETTAVIAVNSLSNQLAKTPPFLSQPVVLAYTPYRYVTERKATVRAMLSVSDPTTGYADALRVNGTSQFSVDAIRAVLDSDQSGLRNREPVLTPAAQAIEVAFEQLRGEMTPALQRFASRAAILRGEASARKKETTYALGYALLAADLGATDADLALFKPALDSLATTPVEQLASLKINTPALAAQPLREGFDQDADSIGET